MSFNHLSQYTHRCDRNVILSTIHKESFLLGCHSATITECLVTKAFATVPCYENCSPLTGPYPGLSKRGGRQVERSLPSPPLPSPPLEVDPLNPARGSGGALQAPPAGVGAELQPKSILVHFSVKIWHLVATILMIFLFTQFLITFICVSKKFKRRGMRRQLPPRS